MSTRGIFGVRIGGKDKLMYNHHDSYPEWLGFEVLDAIRQLLAEHGMDWLKEKANSLQMVKTDIDVPTEEQIERLKPYTDLGVKVFTPELFETRKNIQVTVKR